MFIGRVIGNLAEQPEQHDKTFCFNEKEARTMADNLKGTPVQLEHHKDMKVGSIRKAFYTKSGVWVIGELNENSLTTEFAKKAMESRNGATPYYTGLSLSHSHCEYADGTTKKFPIEVSMCNDPRRPDCRIVSTKKGKYNTPIKSTKMTEPTNQISTEDLTKCILEQEMLISNHKASVEKKETQLKDMQEKVLKLEAQNTLAIEESAKRKKDQYHKAEGLVLALKTHWAKILDSSDYTKVDQDNLDAVIKRNPADMMEVLRLAHCASKHYQNRNNEFDRVNKKRKLDTVANDVGDTLAPKALPDIMDVLSKYKVNGSASDLMRQAYDARNGL